MFLFTDPLQEFQTQGQTTSEIIKGATDAYKEAVKFENAVVTLTAMENEAKKVGRAIGSGVVMGDNFRNALIGVYEEVRKIGADFEDVTKVTQSLAEATNKMTLPIKEASIRMIELSKSTGMGTEEVAKMTAEFMHVTFSQKKSVQEMSRIAEVARKTGLNAEKLLSNVQSSLSKLNAFNFKKGQDGLTAMAAQAQRLGKELSDIKAFDFAEELMDPEKAIEAASSFSMLGGSVEGLTNPLQLMNDAANNVENLQNKMIDMAKSAFKIDESTGKIETNFLAQQRLRQQVKIFSGDYEKYLELGKTAAKEQLVQNKLLQSGIKLSQFSEEQQNLIKSLSEIGPGGKIELNLPTGTFKDLGSNIAGQPQQLKKALEEYQAMAKKSDRQLAEQGLNLQEKMQVDQRIIRDTLLSQLSKNEITTIVGAAYQGQKDLYEEFKTIAKPSVAPTKVAVLGVGTTIAEGKQEARTTVPTIPDLQQDIEIEQENARTQGRMSDAMFGDSSGKVLSLGKGEIFNFIKEDEALFAPNAIKNVGILKDIYMNFMGVAKTIPKEVTLAQPKNLEAKSVGSTNISTNNTNTINTNNKDTIDVNINVNLDGKNIPNGPLSNMLFSNPSTIKMLENKVMEVLGKQDIKKKTKGRYNR